MSVVPRSTARRSALAPLLCSCLALVGGLVAAPSAYAVDTTSAIVISEVYGGGGNSGAPFTNDFIELYNNGTAPVNLATWSVQYASSAGTSWAKTNLTGTIPAGGYYLIQEGGGATGVALPTPNDTGTTAMAAASGKVALVNTQTALSGCAATCSAAATVVDFVGYGAANDSAGGTPTPGLANTTSAQRKISPVFTNTGNNGADFAVAAPTPAGAGGGSTGPDCSANPPPPECVPGPASIQDIQGPGFKSPLNGQTVSNIPGVVTAVRTATSRGFWIQQTNPDPARANTSSGVFVFSTAPVLVGDAVLVTGKVSDFYTLASGETLANTSSLSVTEISSVSTVTVASHNNTLPPTLALTPTTVPDTYAPTTASGNLEDIASVDPSRSALEFWEAHEGMLVSVDNARVVGPGKTEFGEIYLTTKPDELATPRGGNIIESYAKTPTGRLLVTPVNGTVPPANVGDVLTGTTAGPVDWSTFGGYDIAATTVGTWQDNHLQGTTATPQAADQVAVATYNVENLAPSDPQSKYDALGAGVVTNLKNPDVISVEEIQDNSGATDDGTVAADQTLTKLTAAIAAAGGPAYVWKEIDPVNDQDGGQPGGNIRSVFLYNPDRVTFVDKAAGTSTDPVTVGTAPDGTVDLSVNPGRVDPTNSAWTTSRKPLTGEFVFRGKKVIVIANHFNSKGGDQSADGRFQPPTRSSEVQRTQQATVLNGFVKSLLAVDPRANIVLAGDFNDYQFSGPVTTLTDNGDTLTDLINTLPVNERYTYVFSGVSQVLDHIFLSKPISDFQYDVVHVNSEFAGQISDHDPQVVRIRPVAHLSTQGTVALDPSTAHPGDTTNLTLAGWDPHTALTIALDGATSGTVTTDESGAASFTLTVPAGTMLGAHAVTATTSDDVSASASLTVVSTRGTVVLDPAATIPGGSTTVTLAGWDGGASLVIALDGAPKVTVTADASGAATYPLAVPAGTTIGSHTISVTTTDDVSASATLTVKTPIRLGTVSGGRGQVGQGVKVTLSDFAPNTAFAISIDGGPMLTTVTTDKKGSAKPSIIIPAGTTVGTHQIVVTAPDGGQVRGVLLVTK